MAALATGLAAAVRLPYLAESFWVDELHSAWTVWGDLGDVARRAGMGNQTPVYYWGLWFWRQLVGDGEIGLRMSSVMLSSLACGVVAAGVARHSRSLAGGLAAGGALALEPNAIFYGTELRVFAAVMLLAAVACWAWLEHQRTASTQSAVTLLVTVALAAIIQPTSLGVLGWLCISCFRVRQWVTWLRRPLAGSRSGIWLLLTVLAITLIALLLWWLAGRVLLSAWQHRGQWAAFASADSPWQIWTIWQWPLLLLIPAALASGLAIADRVGIRSCRYPSGLWMRPALLAILATVFFWLVSASGIAAVFHRRYLIAALPILIWAGAAAIGEACCRIQRLVGTPPERRDAASPWRRSADQWTQRLLLVLVAAGLALPVISRLRDAQKLPRLRGEAWRVAVAYVAANVDAGTPVLLSPGLIETRRLLAQGEPADIEYLAYPLSGPYHWEPVRVIDLRDEPHRLRNLLIETSTGTAILRCSKKAAQGWAERIVTTSDPAISLSFSVHSFGGVQVVRFRRTADPIAPSPPPRAARLTGERVR